MAHTTIQGTELGRPAGTSTTDSQAAHAFRVALVLFVALTASALHMTYRFFYIDWSWQLVTATGAVAALAVITFVSMLLSRRNRVLPAIRVMVAGILVTSLVLAALLADLGLILSLSVVLITWIIVAQTLPQREVNLMLLIGFIVGVAMGALDVWPPIFQLSMPQIRTSSLITGVVIGVAYLALVIWRFRSYNLRTKLVTMSLIISMLSAGAVGMLSSRATSEALSNNAGTNLESQANVQAVAVGDLLTRQVDALQTLSLSKSIQDGVMIRGRGYVGDLAVIEAELREIEKKWKVVDDTDILVVARLSPTINAITSDLLEFRKIFPAHVEVLATDKYGALAAATHRVPDYYLADEEWWKAAFNQGRGGIYLSQPRLDESSATHKLTIAVPIYIRDTREVAGVLASTYDLAELAGLLAVADEKSVIHSDLVLPGGKILTLDQERHSKLAVFPMWEQLVSTRASSHLEGDVDGVLSLVGQAPVSVSMGHSVVNNLGWRVVSHQDMLEALVPVTEQAQATLFLTLVIIGITAGIAVFVSQRLAGPIARLTNTAQRVAGGDLSARTKVETGDEIGMLATTLNTMTDQLRFTIDTLEERVAERTQEIQTVVEVSQRLAGILDLSDLLRQVVTTTKETFGYYHVHIYLLDEQGQTLRVAEGYGEAGRELKRQGHDISLNASRSLVARAAREGQTIRIEDVQKEPDWLPNPLLPETRSEMAVPVKLGDEVVGVLDIQSAQLAGLSQEDEATVQILANQIAVGVRNARLFSQTQEALYQAQKLQRMYTGQAWEKLAASRATTHYEFRQPTLPPLGDPNPPEAIAALQQEQTVAFRLPKATVGVEGTATGPDEPAQPGSTTQAKSLAALATPLKLRGEIIGVLGIHTDDPERQWNSDEIALIEAVSEQMSLAIENARLFEETGRRAGRERVIAQVTRQVWASGELERVMQTAVEQLGATLDASKVIIRLGTDDQLEEALP